MLPPEDQHHTAEWPTAGETPAATMYLDTFSPRKLVAAKMDLGTLSSKYRATATEDVELLWVRASRPHKDHGPRWWAVKTVLLID